MMTHQNDSANFPPLEGLILDWDGTLVDSPRLVMDFQQGLCRDHGKPFPIKDYEDWRRQQREPFWTFYRDVLGFDWKRDEKSITAAFEDYMKSHEIPLKEGMRSVVTLAAGYRLNIGIASSNTTEVIRHTLHRLGISGYIPAVVGSDSGLRGKPHPDQLLRCAELLGTAPSTCLYVGDIVWDIHAARAAGMRAAAVEGGLGSPADLQSAKPDHFAPSSESLWAYITQAMDGH